VSVGGLEAATNHVVEEVEFTTLPSLGELRCVFTTANDVHFGETVCGRVEGGESFEVYRSEEGETPYPEVMSASVVADMQRCEPAAVVVKGDLTDDGVDEDYARFLEVWGGAFSERLIHVRGNHDCYRGQSFAAWPCQSRRLDGATLAVIDTSRPFQVSGSIGEDQLDWLDELGASADQPVVVLGHHPLWNPGSDRRTEGHLWLDPDDSAALVEVIARRPALSCYLAGHTHRNRRHLVGGVPFVEVACVKDYPGGWAEYRVYERGIAQMFHRASAPAAVAWAERTRGMFGGFYGPYALGELSDRSFVIETATG